MLDGCFKYSTYTKKGVPYCDRLFSVDEFNALTAQRNRLTEAARRKGEELRAAIAEMARV
jgi:hypothetical protein